MSIHLIKNLSPENNFKTSSRFPSPQNRYPGFTVSNPGAQHDNCVKATFTTFKVKKYKKLLPFPNIMGANSQEQLLKCNTVN